MRHYIIVAFMAVSIVSACATTNTDYTLRPDEIEALTRYNTQREAGSGGETASSSEQTNTRPGAHVPHPAPYHVSRPAYGVPQNIAALYTPVPGCSRALLVKIRNRTDYYLKLVLDGQELVVAGSAGGLPHVPPGESAYVCLSHIGSHGLSGVAYANRYGQLVESHRFTRPVAVSGNPRGAGPYHNLLITEGMMRRYTVP